MKKIILFVSVIFLLVSCNENKGIDVPTSDSINEIKVEKGAFFIEYKASRWSSWKELDKQFRTKPRAEAWIRKI